MIKSLRLTVLSVVVGCCVCGTAIAQTLVWQQSISSTSGGASTDALIGTSRLNDGSLISFGTVANTGVGNDWCITKHNSSGTLQWRREQGSAVAGTTDDRITTFRVDPATGDFYVAGWIVKPSTNGDWRICKYNSAGTLQWTRDIAGTDSTSNPPADRPMSLQVDGSGNVYVVGYVYNTLLATDWMVVRLNPSTGVIVWSQVEKGDETASGFIDDQPRSVAITSDSLYVTGYVSNITTSRDWRTVKYALSTGARTWTRTESPAGFGPEEPTSMLVTGSAVFATGWATPIGATGSEIRTIKYDLTGTKIWTRNYSRSTTQNDVPSSLFEDGSGNLYVWGSSIDTHGPDWTLLKYNSAGTQQWAYLVDGGGSFSADILSGVFIASDGNLVMYGSTAELGYVQQWSLRKVSSAGVLVWNKTKVGAQGGGNNTLGSVQEDASGNLYALGILHNITYLDWALVRYNSAGTELGTLQVNGSLSNSSDAPRNLIRIDATNFILTGVIDQTVTGADWNIRRYSLP